VVLPPDLGNPGGIIAEEVARPGHRDAVLFIPVQPPARENHAKGKRIAAVKPYLPRGPAPADAMGSVEAQIAARRHEGISVGLKLVPPARRLPLRVEMVVRYVAPVIEGLTACDVAGRHGYAHRPLRAAMFE